MFIFPCIGEYVFNNGSKLVSIASVLFTIMVAFIPCDVMEWEDEPLLMYDVSMRTEDVLMFIKDKVMVREDKAKLLEDRAM
ncbi:MAG: hypothetical protein HY960_10890 [Ignavibacteriae bacterium]|nr:hypothetical protein [Ignavibacteriota bacterium]